MRKFCIVFAAAFIFMFFGSISALEIGGVLEDGSIIVADLAQQSDEGITISNATIGSFFIPVGSYTLTNIDENPDSIAKVETTEVSEVTDADIAETEEFVEVDEVESDCDLDDRVRGEVAWDNFLSLGLTLTSGNSELINTTGSFQLNRNRMWIDEWTFTADLDYRLDGGDETYRKIDTALRYGFSITEKLYGFVKVSGEQDVSSSLDYKVIPATGVGYWISDSCDFKLMGEAGIGYEYASYSDPRTTQDVIIHFRGYTAVQIRDNLSFDDSFKFIPVISFSSFTFENNAELILDITDSWAFVVDYEIDYDSNPSVGVNSWDHSFSTKLKWNID